MSNNVKGKLNRTALLVPVIIFVVTLGLFSLQWLYGPSYSAIMGDVTATAAERVQAGDIPYRDFWTMYAPGSFYLLALLFFLFGNHILVGSVFASILSATAVCLCHRLVANVVGGIFPAVTCAAIFFAAIYVSGYYLNLGPYPPAIVLVLVALILSFRFHKSNRMSVLFAAGVATGLVMIFKHDVGAYTAIGVTAGLVAGQFCQETAGRWSRLARLVLIYSGGAALVSIPVFGYFAVAAGEDMWQDLVVFPATDFRFARPELYPGILPTGVLKDSWPETIYGFLEYLRLKLPVIIALAAVVTFIVSGIKKNRTYIPMALTFVLLFFFHYSSAQVQINTNMISMPLYAVMLGAIAFRIVDANIREFKQVLLRLVTLAVAGLCFLAFALQPMYQRFTNDETFEALAIPKLSGVRVLPEHGEKLKELVGFVDENIPRHRRIFIGLHRHDTTVIGSGWTYFILDRQNATRQDQLHPGVVDTAKIQREMIRDLNENEVDYLLLKRDVFTDEDLDELRITWSKTLPESGSKLLDEYIENNYRKVRTIGQYEILRKVGAE